MGPGFRRGAIEICPRFDTQPGFATISRKGETDMAGNGQTVIDLDKKRMTAMAEKDIKTLNEIISDDLIYTHSSARLDTKKSLIGNMESGSTLYTSVVPSKVKAQDLGDTAGLTGECKIS